MPVPPPDAASTCLVTGASSGIGVELARELARRGHGLTLVARRENRLKELADDLQSAHGVRAEVIAADLADPSARQELVATIAERGLQVDVLVNNAGLGSSGQFSKLDRQWQVDLVRIDVEAVVDLAAAFLPGMVERGRGAILNVASTAAYQPLPGMATYAAAKAFVLSFSQSLASEAAPHGVTVTALCPGPVKTEFGERAGLGEAESRVPGFIWTSTEHVARSAIDGLYAGRLVVIPGPLNQFGAVAGRFSPRRLLLPVVRRFSPAIRG